MAHNMLSKITVLLGPTASGKSAWALELARAFDFEIINADSRQVYKELTIGTAKPVGEWRAHPQTGEQVYMVDSVPHYLMDMIEVAHPYTVAEWKETAEKRAQEIMQRGKHVLIVGGTGLYIDALVKNFQMPVRVTQKNVRENLQKKTLEELIELLRAHDPASSARIDMQNPRRVTRALEVFLTTGKSFVEQQKQSAPMFDALQIGVHVPFDELTKHINERVDTMMRNGWLEEVRMLLQKGYTDTVPAIQSVGYREIILHLQRKMDFDEAIKRIKISTRQYAKRQMTWFKRNHTIKWVHSFANVQSVVENFYT